MSEKPIEESGLNEQPQPRQTEPQEQATAPVLPGAQLAARRSELNLSIEEAANRLNLAPRQILAMESDNYSALPGMPITRGFIRSYARLLDLEPASLLGMLPNEPGISKTDSSIRRALPAKPFYVSRSSFEAKRNGGKKIGIAAAGFMLLAVMLIGLKLDWYPQTVSAALKEQIPFFGSSEDKNKSPGEDLQEKMPMHADRESGNDLPVPAVPTMQQAPDSNPQSAIEADTASLKERGTLASVPVKEETAKPPVLTGNAGAQNQNKDALVLKVIEESWIEVRDANRKVLISRLAKPGETETLAVTTPLDLKIGNVAGVEASLRGAPVELKSAAQGNVARLTVK